MFETPAEKEIFKGKCGQLASYVQATESKRRIDLSIEDSDLNELIALLSNLAVHSFSNRKETLEDYFMKFYKEDKDFGGALQ